MIFNLFGTKIDRCYITRFFEDDMSERVRIVFNSDKNQDIMIDLTRANALKLNLALKEFFENNTK